MLTAAHQKIRVGRCRSTVLLLLVLMAGVTQRTVVAQQLRAGAAAIEINPPIGEPIVGGFVPYPSTNIHDALHARCLLLHDGTNQIAFVVCDSLKIDRAVFDEARELIAA
ncbi:MAG: hypothetical protein KDA85_22680, partial [Planctomycetaceae bacterium]|nr:hypothetical protein [Planctomycetaceae bacterium]